jgi:bile acid-coenzyme A ligase
MGSLLTYQAQRDPAAPVLTMNDETWSRARLDAAANKRARALQTLGVKHNDFVTIALANSPAFYETVLATWKLGAIPNPVSSRLPQAEIDALLDLVRPAVAIGDAAANSPGLVLPSDWRPDETLSAAPLPEIVAAHWKAVPSGGSTGRPKVIVDNHPSTWSPDTTMTGQRLGDTILNPGPLYHNAPFSISHVAMLTGGHVVDMGKFDAIEALRLIEQYRIGYAYMVPTMMHRIWRLPAEERERFDLSSLKTLIHMAAPCPAWLKQAFIEWLGPDIIWESYGGTENIGSTTIRGDAWLTHRGSVGKATRGSLMILGKEGEQLPTGEVGEVHFKREPGFTKPYHYLGAVSDEGDVETIGDLGWMDEEGYLYLADRRTDLIISGGANIYAAEVEAAIDAMPGVGSSVVIGLPDEDLGQRVHAIVQQLPGHVFDDDRVRAFLARQLVRYKIPRSFEFVTETLRDDAGKARRSALVAERTAVSA